MTGRIARNEGDSYPDDDYKLVTVACVVSILSIIVVAARFFATQLKKAKIGPDDWISIPALVIVAVLTRRLAELLTSIDCLCWSQRQLHRL